MKIFSICDDKNIQAGLRLVGIDGIVIESQEQFIKAYENVVSDRQVAVVIVPRAYADKIIKLKTPLVVEI